MANSSLEEIRIDTSSLKTYLKELLRSFSVMVWYKNSVISDAGNKAMVRMVLWMVVETFLVLVPSWGIGLLVDHIFESLSTAHVIVIGVTVAAMASVACKWRMARAREFVLGEVFVENLNGVSRKFFSKAPLQYEEKDSVLSSNNIESAQGYIWEVVWSVVFMAPVSILHLVLAYGMLWFVYAPAALLMTLAILNFLGFAAWQNVRLARTLTPIDTKLRAYRRQVSDLWEHATWALISGRKDEILDHIMGVGRDVIEQEDRPAFNSYIDFGSLRDIIAAPLVGLALYLGVTHIAAEGSGAGFVVPMFAWMGMATGYLRTLGEVERTLARRLAPLMALKEALETVPSYDMNAGGPVLSGVGGLGVEVDCVTFIRSRETDPKTTLQDVTFEARPGERIGVVGPTGAGKTTLLKVLARFDDPADGEVRYDGVPLSELDTSAFWSQIAYVTQECPVMSGTVRDNLLFGVPFVERSRFTDEQLLEALERVKLLERVQSEGGLESRVGKRGIRLSGGEQQRLVLAAAILRKPRLLLIDEGLSALDAETKAHIMEHVFARISRDTTVIVVAHNFSTIRSFCDRIIMMEAVPGLMDGQGQIVAQGTFEELAMHNRAFRAAAQRQHMIEEDAVYA